MARRDTVRSWLRRYWPWLYLLALGASLLTQALIPEQAYYLPKDGLSTVTIPAMGRGGPAPDRTIELAYQDWPAAGGAGRPPVIVIHGSPGDGSNFNLMAPELTARGWRIIAPDLPGFGASRGDVPNYSNLAHARALVAMLEALDIERAHVVGWSNGGAVGLWMADLAPERIASVTLLAATGAQHTEGSGSYWFEHAKYGFGIATLVAGAELVPHFGLLGPRQMRWAFLRSFWDSDQRPLAGIMANLETPTLILHGRHDFLIGAWAAEEHHRIMRSSRLVITGGNHFMPFLEPAATVGHLAPFLARHDTPGVAPLVQIADLAPAPRRPGLLDAIERGADALHDVPWWIEALGLGLLAFGSRWLALGVAGYLVTVMSVDFGVASVGLLLGALLHQLRDHRAAAPRSRQVGNLPHSIVRAAGHLALMFFRILIALTVAMILGHLLIERMIGAIGPGGLLLWIVGTPMVIALLRDLGTWTGRQRLKARIARLWRHEFWPWYIYYLPLVIWIPWLALRHRGLMSFTCVNPSLGPGGGVIGESKTHILRALGDDPAVLAHAVIDARADGDAGARLAQLEEAIATRPALGGWPIILKPDRGERGYAVRLCRGPADAREHLAAIPDAIIAQRYHAGPEECGLLWVRRGGAPHGGRIFSITRKDFQRVTGDGERTLERLILADRRFRMQHGVFLRRFADQRRRVLARGETLRLAEAGNHAQGTRFRDGADLITPELTARIAAIARTIPDFDFGRFDLRYTCDDDLRRGEGFAIIELNGATSESTNMYDANRSVLWAWGVLLRQWEAVYRLGAVRRRAGARPMGPFQLIGVLIRERCVRRSVVAS
ncbi:MAG: alpha/beta fold hydrolase [Phycisphaerales bacterium JB039]